MYFSNRIDPGHIEVKNQLSSMFVFFLTFLISLPVIKKSKGSVYPNPGSPLWALVGLPLFNI